LPVALTGSSTCGLLAMTKLIMWYKYLIITVLLYLFAVMQNSFFVHFSFFGAVPNFVFIIFFTLIFFTKNDNYCQIAFVAAASGLFLDIFSYMRFGTSIIFLLAIGFIFKKIQSMLQMNRSSDFPLIYFLPIFTVMLAVYSLILNRAGFNIVFAAELIYNLFFATIAFYIYKRFLRASVDDHQLKLFN